MRFAIIEIIGTGRVRGDGCARIDAGLLTAYPATRRSGRRRIIRCMKTQVVCGMAGVSIVFGRFNVCDNVAIIRSPADNMNF
jgi:hypothetical protein